MKTIVFFVPYVGLGGTETLVMRLMYWYSFHFYRVILLIGNTFIDLALQKERANIKAECYVYDTKYNFFHATNGNTLTFTPSEFVSVVSFSIIDFLRCYKLLSNKKYDCFFLHRIYIIHPNWSLLSKYTQWIKPLILLLLKEKTLVFMDEETRAKCINSYKLNELNLHLEILRLPIIINETIVSKPKDHLINILSISRFEFPFKGYLLGLIDTFGKLALEHITLTIIGGAGKENELINQKIILLPKEIQSRINILGRIPYSEIDSAIDQCDLFIGMGTTILDAANRNKICIVSVAYQEDDFTTGFFDTNYKNVGSIYNEKEKYFHFQELIQEVISLDNKAFTEKEDLTKSLLIEHYDINKIAPKLIESHQFSVLDKCKIFIYSNIVAFFDLYRKN
ncbi:hypothetical protein EZS27_028099 [termite gut metagenome]|uniref:Glycosyl transferase family 1 domain-containing protein n=1 Tax=termite gut metagenome TaxID=433724 RepID=A0A5J4QN00_9ZZZZ